VTQQPLLDISEAAVGWARRFGSPVVACEHLWLAVYQTEQAAGAGPQVALGITLDSLELALAAHVGLTTVPVASDVDPAGFTPKAFEAMRRASEAADLAVAPERAVLRALLEVPNWSGYQVLQDLAVDARELRHRLGLASELPTAHPTSIGGRRLVTFPSGTSVWTCPLVLRTEDQATPDFGLYLDARWRPTWPARVMNWPDFGVPVDPVEAASAISEAMAAAIDGKHVEIGCGAALGRTGVALACMAILDGVPADKAVAWVRANYDQRAIETRDQEQWVLEFATHHRNHGG